MAKTNFKFEKRQKELAKQKKAEEKRLRKLGLLEDKPEEEAETQLSDEEQVEQWLSK